VDVARLYRLADRVDPDLAVFLVVAASSGARRSGLIALRWSDVDLSNRRVRIDRGIVLGLYGLVENDTKTHSARTVALDPPTIELLEAHRARAATCRAEAALRWDQSNFVLGSTRDGATPWFPDSASRRFHRLCAEAGIAGVRLHGLRHYVATRLLTAGVDLRTVAGRLGHRNAATTLNVYAHLLVDADRDAARRLGDLF